MSLRFRVQARVVSDPLATAEDVADILDTGPRPTSWMQRLRHRSDVSRNDAGVYAFASRPCCFDHLRVFDERGDIPMPYRTACTECGRLFEVTLAPDVAPGTQRAALRR